MGTVTPNMLGFTLFIIVALNSVVAIEECKSGCSGESGLLKLSPGTTYEYDYEGKISILLSSAEGQETKTDVAATVLLTQQNDCSQVLRLKNVQIIGPDGKKRIGIPDVEKPVILNNNNGILNDFVCAEQGDNQNSLNLKRAIASFFQVSLEKNAEIDVFGQCPIQTSKIQDGDIITITKNKNLNKCAFRESITHNIIHSTFNLNSDIQSSPILSSSFDSKQKIKGGVLDSASIVENYLFVPFSVGQNGAKAAVESKLTLTKTSKDNPSTSCKIPKSIIFENPHPVNVQRSNAQILLKKIKEISEKIGTNVEETTAVHFVDLVKLLRVSKKVDILSVYNQVRSGAGFSDKDGAKKILLDAILISGNGDNIEVAIELLKNKELSALEERQLYAGLSHARHVTEGSIKTATDLLNRPNLPRESYLGIGSLAGRYCAQHDCEKVEQINKIIQKFLSKLGDLNAANRKEESDMIYVLKGLTNIGHLNDVILSKLVSLTEDKKQPVRLRVATLEAFKAAPCKDKLRDSALKILKDIYQDSEIRIKAYLALTICPNDKIGNSIKELLGNEKSHQVGGFISSHVKNLRWTTNPDKALAKAHLGFIHTSSKFRFDPTKYSFNGEFSYALDAIGASNNIEGNVIYSQNSWLPRSTNLNLTAEVLGQRINFLEIAARQENLDRVIEHYLGPQGVLNKLTLQQNWDHTAKPIAHLWKTLKEKLNKSLRSRRDISTSDINEVSKKFLLKENALDKNLDLDISVKNFGSEVLFMNSFDVTDKLSPHGIIDNFIGKLNEGLDKLKNFEKILRTNLLFLDAELSYPTSLGFPLRLGIDGAANIQIKTSGQLDVRELVSSPSKNNGRFKLSIIPSATATVIGRFSLDTPLLENGLKVASTIHSSTGSELVVENFKDGLGKDVKLSFPVEKQKLIDLKHEIIFQTKENGIVLKNQRLKFSQNKDFSICIDHLRSYIGLEFCVDINGPNLSGKQVPILSFPFSGDAKASVKIERGDIDTFHYRRELSSEGTIITNAKVTLETLNKNGGVGIGVNVEASISPEKYVKASLVSPIKNAEVEGRLIVNNELRAISFSLKDEGKLYTAKVGLKVEAHQMKTRYTPLLEYTTPEKKGAQVPPFHLKGEIVSEKHGKIVKYFFHDVKLVIPGQKTFTLNGVLGSDAPGYSASLTLSDGSASGTFKGNLLADPHLFKIHAELKNSLKPILNFNFKGEFKRHDGTYSSHIQFAHGDDVDSKSNTLTLVNILHLKHSKELEVSIKNKLHYPKIKLNAKFDMEKTHKSLDYDVFLHYGEVKVGSELKLKQHMKSHGDYQLEFQVHAGKNKAEFKSSRLAVGSSDSKIDNSFVLNDKKIEVSGKIKHHVKPNDLHIGTDLVIKLPKGHAVIKLNQGLKLNPKEIDLHIKYVSGSDPLIDTVFKSDRGLNANGHIKVNFKEILHINGHIKSQKGVGNGHILIEAKILKKSVKAETSFNMHRPTYNLDLTLYPEFHNDKSKKVVLSTKNKCSGSHIESSSTLNLFGTEFLLKAKGPVGHLWNGKTALDIDLTLPGKHNIIAKIQRDVTFKDGVLNLNSFYNIEFKATDSTPSTKFNWKLSAKDTNFRDGILDLTLNYGLVGPAGSDFDWNGSLKRQFVGTVWKTEYHEKMVSSRLDYPKEHAFISEGTLAVNKFSIKYYPFKSANLFVKGNYDLRGQKNPLSVDVDMEMNTPFEVLSNIKLSDSVFFKYAHGDQPASLKVSGSLQTTSSNPNGNINTKGELNLEGNKNLGSAKIHGEVNKPFATAVDISGSYKVDSEKKSVTAQGNFKSVLPENKIIEGSASISRPQPQEYNIEAVLNLPTEKFKTNKLKINNKRDRENVINSQVELISDDKKYLWSSELCVDSKEPKIDVKFTHPDGRISQILASSQRPNKARFLAKLKVDIAQTLLEGSLDVNSENLDNFNVQVTANCPKLKINDILVKIGNTNANAGNSLDVLITSAGKSLVSGSATVSSREEQGKFIVEGSGNFKVNGEQKSGNFKFIRTALTQEKNGEIGDEISFDASVGNKAVDAELKLTNKEFRYLNSYCEESKQCAHVEITAKTSTNDLYHYNNLVEITIDLRILGIPNEFGLKAVTHRENWLLDHTVDVHFENSANKYQYSVYVHPKESGISLTTPKRVIALEANIDIPTTDIQKAGKITGEVCFYTDKKNNPNSKSSLKGFADINLEGKSVNAEISFIAAAESRPLTIKYKEHIEKKDILSSYNVELIIDIFDKPDDKIVLSQIYTSDFSMESYKINEETLSSIRSSGLGLDATFKEILKVEPKALTVVYNVEGSIKLNNNKYDSNLSLDGSSKGTLLLVKLLNQELLKSRSRLNLKKGLIEVKTDTSLLGNAPIESSLEIKNYNTLKFIQYLTNNPSKKIVITAAFVPGEIAEAIATHETGGSKHDLVHASLKLNSKEFLKPEANANVKNIEELSKDVKKFWSEQLQDLKLKYKKTGQIVEDVTKAGEDVLDSIPNLSNSQKFYGSEIHKFKDELAADKTLEDLAHLLKGFFAAASEVLSKVINAVSNFVEKIAAAVNNAFAGVMKTIETTLIPILRRIVNEGSSFFKAAFTKASDIFFLVLGKVAEIVKALQPQLKAISDTLSEISGDVGNFLNNTFETIKKALLEQLHHLKEEIKASPIFVELKAQYDEFVKKGLPSQEVIVNTVKSISGALKDLIVFPEFQKVIDLIENYIEKKITNKPVDDVAELEKIGSTLIDGVAKFGTSLSKEVIPEISKNIKLPQLNLELLKRLPINFGGIRLSSLDFLLKEDLTPFKSYLTHLLHLPSHLKIPPAFHAEANGGEFVTFDRVEYHVPHSCNILAATDAINGNFSIILGYKNKALDAVTYVDKYGSVTMAYEKVLVDQKESDYPIHREELEVYRFVDYVFMHSSFGVQIVCHTRMSGCGITVSGFYQNQLRGILGNANHEEYDELTLPNGQITSSIEELTNAYNVGTCTDKTPLINIEDTKPDPICEKVFGWNSPMSHCRPFVNFEDAKKTCEFSVANGNLKAPQMYALNMVYLCWKVGVPVKAPYGDPCENGVVTRKFGEEFEVKLPGKAADVLFVVSAHKINEVFYKEYIQHLGEKIVTEYKEKGITDVVFHLVVYNGENTVESLATVKGSTTFKELPNIKFSEPPKPWKLITGCDELDKALGSLRTFIKGYIKFLGLGPATRAYNTATHYPFRAEAVRSIVGILDTECEGYLPVPISKYIHHLDKHIHIAYIHPGKHLKIKNDKAAHDVIGFNSKQAFTLSNQAVPLKDIAYEDLCFDFIVQNGGTVFSSQNMMSHKDSKDKVLEIVAKALVDQSLHRKASLECTCDFSYASPFIPYNHCKLVDVEDK